MTSQKQTTLELQENKKIDFNQTIINIEKLLKPAIESNNQNDKDIYLLSIAKELNIDLDIKKIAENKTAKKTIDIKKIKRNMKQPNEFNLLMGKELNDKIALFNQEANINLAIEQDNKNMLFNSIIDNLDSYLEIVKFICNLKENDLNKDKLNYTDLILLNEIVNGFLLTIGTNQLKNSFISITPLLTSG